MADRTKHKTRVPWHGVWLVAGLLGLGWAGLPVAEAASAKARPASASKASASARGTAAARKTAPRKATARTQPRRAAAPPPRLSFAERAGLHATPDPLDLKAAVALVLDAHSHEVLLGKNESAVLPIASLSKLMTALLVLEAELPLDEAITITEADVDTLKGTRSRLPVGTTLSRGELLHLALMSSENRAAHALGRSYPGGIRAFVSAMNARAQLLGMGQTRFVEPTGLSSENRSSARDLARLVAKAARVPLISRLSTSTGHEVALDEKTLEYRNTNALVFAPEWDIGLQKTGYISEAGQCLVMHTRLTGRELIMVFLAADSRPSRLADAERVRDWVLEQEGQGGFLAQARAF